jgi:hypothetical protein
MTETTTKEMAETTEDTTQVPVPAALDTSQVLNYLTNITKALDGISTDVKNQIAGIITEGQKMQTKETEGETNNDDE